MKVPATIRLLVLIVIGAIVAAAFLLPVREYLIRFLESVNELGIWGPVLVIAFYVIACLLFIPGSLVTLGIGFLFGVVWGTIIVSLGSTLGATAAFSPAGRWREGGLSGGLPVAQDSRPWTAPSARTAGRSCCLSGCLRCSHSI